MADLADALSQRIADALTAGRKIEAIKIYREATGCGLKEAKEFVEELMAGLDLPAPSRLSTGGEATPQGPPGGLAGNPRLAMIASAIVAALIVLASFLLFLYAK